VLTAVELAVLISGLLLDVVGMPCGFHERAMPVAVALQSIDAVVMSVIESKPAGHEDWPTCNFCGNRSLQGVAGATPATFACDDCIALMVEIRREALGPTWPDQPR